MKRLYKYLEAASFKYAMGESWKIMTVVDFFFLNGLEMEIGILSWQRCQPLDSDLKLYMSKSLRGTDKKCKVNSVRV